MTIGVVWSYFQRQDEMCLYNLIQCVMPTSQRNLMVTDPLGRNEGSPREILSVLSFLVSRSSGTGDRAM